MHARWRASISRIWEKLQRLLIVMLQSRGVSRALAWFDALYPVIVARRLLRSPAMVIFTIGLFVLEVIFFGCSLFGLDVRGDVKDAINGDLDKQIARVRPFKTAEVFGDYVGANDKKAELLPLCLTGQNPSTTKCRTITDTLQGNEQGQVSRFVENIPRRFVRVPGGIVHSADYIGSQGGVGVAVLVLPVLVLGLIVWEMPKSQLLNPYSLGWLLLALGVIGLLIQWSLVALVIVVRYTLACLGVIKMAEVAVGFPRRATELVDAWRAANGIAVATEASQIADTLGAHLPDLRPR